MRPLLAALAGGLLVAAAPAAAGGLEAAPAQVADWTQRVEVTGEGGYRMGNPDASVKLVEYASITCSHCATFNAAAAAPLRSHVRSGRVSWEVRPFLIFPSDPGIFLLLQCQAPAHFFTVSDQLFATQDAWTGRIMANAKRLQGLAQHEQVGAVVRAAGVERLFRERGMSEARIASCLADQAALQRLGEQQQRHVDAGVQGTPTFFINGRHVDAADWASLEPLLRAP